MPQIIKVSGLYDRAADSLFAEAIKIEDMIEAMTGFAVYAGLPRENFVQGKTYTADVTFWGVMKNKSHAIHVERIDRQGRVMQTRERSPSITMWDHTLTVTPQSNQTLWTDHVIIDAGWQTGLIARFAVYMYQYRHRKRGALRISTSRQKA